MGNSSFAITAAWSGISQPSGPTLGGTSVLVSGAGFSQRAGVSYRCSFAQTGVHGPVTSPAYFVSGTSLSCTSPPWPHAGVTVLTVEKNGAPLGLVGPQSVLFEYQSGGFWITASPTFGPAEGGYDLTVTGNGLDSSATDYFMFMYGADAYGNEQTLVASCVPSSSVLLVCPVPAWIYGEASLRVELVKGESVVSKQGEAFSYTFTSYWNRIATPTYGVREGGTRVTIAGNAFFPTATNVRCRWIGITDDNIPVHVDTTATVHVSTEVECDTPAWIHHEQVAELSLYSIKGGQEIFVAFSGEPREARFRFVASWERATTLSVDSRPWPHVTRSFNLAPLGGGSKVTITGAGFDRRGSLSPVCRFSCVDDACVGSATVNVSTHVQGLTSIICVTPDLTPMQGQLSTVKTILSLVHYDGLALYHDVDDHFYIHFTKAWLVKGFSLQGPSSGGIEITVAGSNFCNRQQGSSCDNSYTCEFRQLDDGDKRQYARHCKGGTDSGAPCKQDDECSSKLCSAHIVHTSSATGSRILNNTHLVCVTPSWPYPPANTQLILYDSSFGGEDIPVASLEPTFFEYLAVALSSSPSSLTVSGGNLTIRGMGFVSEEAYACRLHFSGNQMDTNAIVVSPTELICPAPELPAGMIAEKVRISFPDAPQPAGDTIAVTYRPLWFGLAGCEGLRPGTCNSSTGPAAGNFSIYLIAKGLDPAKTYKLLFTDASFTRLSVQLNATVQGLASGMEMVRIPSWKGPAASTLLTLHEWSGNEWLEIALGPAYPSGYSFTFQSSAVSALVGPYPHQGCSGDCWPTTITVAAAGLIPNFGESAHYSCKLVATDGNSTVFSQSAIVWPGADEVKCIFGSSDSAPDYVSGEFDLHVLYHGISVSNYAAQIKVILREVWTAIVCPEVGCMGPASGNTVIGVQGSGFSVSRFYYCRFESPAGERTLAQADFISTNYLECKTPSWTYSMQETNVLLLDENGIHISYEGLPNSALTFQFFASWWLPPVLQYASVYGPAHGDRQVDGVYVASKLKISGIGFEHGGETNVTYFAKLTGLDYDGNSLQGETSRAPANSSSSIELQLIPWNGPQGLVHIQLLQCDANVACLPVSVDPGATVAHPEESVVKTIMILASMEKVYVGQIGDVHYENMCYPYGPVRCWGAASGGQVLQVMGDGFEPRAAYRCRFIQVLRPTVFIDSEEATVLNSEEILCTTPSWPYDSGLVSINLVFDGIQLPQHVHSNETFFYFASSMSRSVPGFGSASDHFVNIEGLSLQGTNHSFNCHFSAKDRSGFPWLLDYQLVVDAVAGPSSNEVACNVSGQWGERYPATDAAVRMSWKTSPVHVQLFMADSDEELHFNASNHLTEVFRALFMEVGTYIIIDQEVMLVTHVPNDHSVRVFRGQRDTSAADHLAGSAVYVLLPFTHGDDPIHVFRAAYTSINIHRSLGFGGQVLTAKISGFAATYQEHTTSLSAHQKPETGLAPSLPLKFKENPVDTHDGTGFMYWGIGFDVFARRSIRVEALEFTALVEGDQKVWIFMRKKSSCQDPLCGIWGFELLSDTWELVGKREEGTGDLLGLEEGFRVHVTSSLRYTINIDSIAIAAGETLGFLIVAEKGIRFTNSEEPGYECLPGAPGRCKHWSDQFASIQPGKIVLSHAIHPSKYPNAFVDALGAKSDPFYYAGTIVYTNDEEHGADYRCRFSTIEPTGVLSVYSPPTKAFSNSFQELTGSRELKCLIPSWAHGHVKANFSIVSGAGEEILLESRSYEIMEFVYSWNQFYGPTRFAASGGQEVVVTGSGFDSAGSQFYCSFTATDGSHIFRSIATIKNASSLSCVSPVWDAPSQSSGFDVVSCLSESECEILPWSPTFISENYTVGTEGSTVCSGSQCSDGTLTSPACLSYPCISTHGREVANYHGRTFVHYDVFHAVDPTQAPAVGGTLLTIIGNGFVPASKYLARFLRGNSSYVTTSQRSRVSNLTFIAPRWGQKFIASHNMDDAQVLAGSLQLFRLTGLGTLASNMSSSAESLVLSGHHSIPPASMVLIGGEIVKITSALVVGNSTAVTVIRRGVFGTAKAIHTVDEDVAILSRIQAASRREIPEMAFDFCASWKIDSVDFDSFSSSVSVNISGAGFKTDVEYYIELTAQGQTVMSEYKNADLTHIRFESIIWNYGIDVPASVSLFTREGLLVCQSGTRSNCFPEPQYVVFYHEWRTMDSSTGYAQGGKTLTIRGAGFEVGSASYKCNFSSAEHQASVHATVTLPFELLCVTPAWTHSAQTTVVSIHKGDQEIPFMGGNVSSSHFHFLEAWDTISTAAVAISANGVQQAHGPARGSTRIFISGGGFDIQESTYFSIFSFESMMMNATCNVTSSTRMHCITPVWGSKFPHKRVDVEIVAMSRLLPFQTHIKRSVPYINCAAPPCACGQAPGCGFEFLAISDGLGAGSPSHGRTLGGINITLKTFGLDPNAQYYCNFTSGPNWAASSSSNPVSGSLMQCTTPMWPYAWSSVRVIIHKSLSESIPESVEASFTYVDSWSSRYPSSSAARRKEQITINGYGFDVMAVNEYACRFQREEISVSVWADVLSETRIVCETPVWKHASGRVHLTLLRSNDPVLHMGGEETADFTFLAGWDERDVSSPREGPASGNDTLIFIGYGFDQTATYECIFARDDERMSSAAIVLSYNRLSCRTPPWGTRFEDSWGDTERASAIPSGTVYVSLNSSTFQKVIPKTNLAFPGPMASVDPPGYGETDAGSCEDSDCKFDFYTIWSDASVPGMQFDRTVATASMSGGQSLVVNGFGFALNATYRCELEGVETAPVKPQSTSVLVCLLPTWDYPLYQRIAGLRILMQTSIVPKAGSPMAVRFVPSWFAVIPSSAPTKGGTMIEVTGGGFEPTSSYTCRFSKGSDEYDVEAFFVQNSTIKCIAPLVSGYTRMSSLAIVDNFGNLLPRYGIPGPSLTEAHFEYMTGWDNRGSHRLITSGQASGGSRLHISGYGFDSVVTYYCNFYSAEESMHTQARVVTNKTLLCVTPAWGHHSSAGTVLIDILEDIDGVNSSIAFTNGGANVVEINNQTCSESTCAFSFYPVWASVPENKGSAVGGAYIRVVGFGFSVSLLSTSNCIFSHGNHTDRGGHPENISVTSFMCRIPKWTGVDLSSGNLMTNFSMHGISAVNDQKLYPFHYVHGWEALDSSFALARGGRLLIVSGAGFSVGSLGYSCVFATQDHTVSTNATVIDVDLIQCPFTEWTHHSGDILFHLFFEGNEVEASFSERATFTVIGSWHSFWPTSSKLSTGGEEVHIYGNGFHVNQPYTCVFSDLAGAQMNSSAVATDFGHISCNTPAWGNFHPAGKVSIEVIGPDNQVVPFTTDGVATLDAWTTLNASDGHGPTFDFVSAWDASALSNIKFASAGGEQVVVSGFGFVDSQTYRCRWQSSENPMRDASSDDAEILGPTEVVCTSPAWAFAHSNVVLQLLEGDRVVPSITSSPLALEIYQMFTSLVPSAASAKGGAVITVNGNAFDMEENYQCLFGQQVTQAVVTSQNAMECIVPAIPDSAQMVNFSVSAGEHLIKHLTSQGSWGKKVYLLSNFSGFQYFGEWLEHFPGFADRIGNSATSITIMGVGFDSQHEYACKFMMNDEPPMSAISSVVHPVNSNKLTCNTPEWDLVTPWISYKSRAVNISVIYRADPSKDWRSVYSHNGTTLPGQVPLMFVHINRAPIFGGVHDIRVPMSSTDRLYTFPQWAHSIASSSLTLSIEDSQTIEFHLSGASATTFSTPPVVHVDGTLSFTVRAEAHGISDVYVLLLDNGGTAYGGVDESDLFTVQIEIYPVDRNLGIVPLPSVTVSENSGAVLLGDFVSVANVTRPDADIAYDSFNFAISCDSSYFQTVPYFVNAPNPILAFGGTLEFVVKAFTFGNAVVTVTLSAQHKNSLGQLSQASSESSFVIEILPVNQAPTHSINASLIPIVVNEDEFTSGIYFSTRSHFVSIERKGPTITEVGPAGEDWPERNQTVSFHVFGSSPLFAVQPSITENGILEFELAKDTNGVAHFQVQAQDDGGVERDGEDRSPLIPFQISVRPVNDAPAFSLFCPEEIAGDHLGWRLSCTEHCMNQDIAGDCHVQIVVDENCANCDYAPVDGCRYPFTFEPLAVEMRASSLDLADEADQTLSFHVVFAGGNHSLFQQGFLPVMDINSGSLIFCLEQDRNGVAHFNVTMQDDNGTEHGGTDTTIPFQLTVTVRPVNQKPGFDICCDEHLVLCEGNDEHYVISDFLTAIRKGDLDAAGNDNEAFQDAYFIVEHNTSSFFTTQPTINTSGVLAFTLRRNVTGSVFLRIVMKDDGGTEFDGVDTAVRYFNITIVNSYLLLRLDVNHTTVDTQDITRVVAQSVGTYPALVSVGTSFNSSSQMNRVTVKISSSSVADTISTVRLAQSITTAVRVSLLPSPTAVILSKVQPYLEHCGHAASFFISRTTIQVAQFQYTTRKPYVLENFIFNITAPQNSPLSMEGKEAIEFRVQPVRYRTRATGFWESVTTDHGLFTSGPTIVPVCEPMCTSANLTFSQSVYYNGEMEFQVSYGLPEDSSVSRLFSVEVLPVNQPPVFVLNRSVVSVCEDSENVSIINLVQSISPGLSKSDSNQNVTFNVSVIGEVESLFNFFSEPPYIQMQEHGFGSLFLPLAIDAYGTITLEIYAKDDGGTMDGGKDTSIAQNVTVIITPRNDPPSFSFNTSLISSGMLDDIFEIIVDENGGNFVSYFTKNCTYPYRLDSYVLDVRPAAANISNEMAQQLSFEMDFIAGDLSIFQEGHLPKIDVTTGHLDFCLAPYRNGEANFSIVLRDDNGTDCDGIDVTVPLAIRVKVLPVNQEPMFEICCDGDLMVWEGEQAFYTFENFITDIRKGHVDAGLGIDTEAHQEFTFSVNSSDFFVQQPAVSPNGTLTFSLQSGMTGTVRLGVMMKDNGGSHGVDTSVKSFNLTVSNSYVLVQVDILNVSSLVLDAVQQRVARSFDVSPVLVSMESILNLTTYTSRLSITIAGSTRQETLARARRWAVVKDTIEDLVTHFCGTECITSERRLLSDPTNSSVSLVSVQAFMKNAGNIPSFSISDNKIVIESLRYNTSNPLTLNHFIYNISTPPNTPMNLDDGTDLLDFVVQPTKCRSSQAEEWVSCSTDRGLLAIGPILEVNSDPTATSANLTLAQAVDYNGEVEFTVDMGSSDVSATFSIRVLLSFTVLQEVKAFENEDESLVEQFFHMTTIGRNDSASPSISFELPGDSWDKLFLPHGRPKLSVGSPYKDLMFRLISGRNGNMNITLNVSMDGRSSIRTFTLIVEAVNSPPSFTLTSSVLEVLQDQYTSQPFISYQTLSQFSAGPPDEVAQNLTFSVIQQTPQDQSPLKNVSVLASRQAGAVSYGETADGNWSAVLSFFTKKHATGSSNLTLILVDDGGYANGGINASSLMSLTIIVIPVNHAPSFRLAQNIIVRESSGLHQIRNFARNICAEPGIDSSWERQNLVRRAADV